MLFIELDGFILQLFQSDLEFVHAVVQIFVALYHGVPLVAHLAQLLTQGLHLLLMRYLKVHDFFFKRLLYLLSDGKLVLQLILLTHQLVINALCLITAN